MSQSDTPVQPLSHPADGLNWRIAGLDDPLRAELVVEEFDLPVFWWELDPPVVRDLLAALTSLRDAQVAAVLGTAASSHAVSPAEASERVATPTTDLPRPWWLRHKIAAAFLFMLTLLFLLGLVFGSAQV